MLDPSVHSRPPYPEARSAAIRERMIQIRDEAVAGQRGRQALSGYSPPLAQPAPIIDGTS